MRIVYVITRADSIGGAQIHVRDLVQGLKRMGHEVAVLGGGRGSFTEELVASGVPYFPIQTLARPIRLHQDIRAIWEVRRKLSELRPNLVCTHSSKAGGVGRVAAWSLGQPATFTAHGWAFTDGVSNGEKWLYRFAEKITALFTQRIITVSEYDCALALRYRVAFPGKLVTVHNGIPDIKPEFKAHPGVEPVNLVMVARFDPPKDHIMLLQALAALKSFPWKLHLIGDGSLRSKVEGLLGHLDLTGRVILWGSCLDVPQRLAEAQVFLLISHWEGLPLSILEAMRAGLPVIASDVGGVREEVIDEETGFLVPQGHTELLTQRLRTLIGDPGLRIKMGQAGRRRYEALFTFDRMLEKTLKIYEDVLKEYHDQRLDYKRSRNWSTS